ncbi:hypothetical protein [Nocardia sp. SC052]|uniref:hypothetical protein n=1 Tax=Nocardia sichangensis TaxID=3385975 RepID=UPI0039A3A157
MQAITEIDGDTATVRPLHHSDRPRLAALLLQAAGPGNARAVRSVSLKGGGRGYQVTTAIAEAAGLVPVEADSEFDSGGVASEIGLSPTTVQEPERVFSPEEVRAFEAWLDAEAAFAKEQKNAEPAKKAPAKKAPPAKAAPRGKATTPKTDAGKSASSDDTVAAGDSAADAREAGDSNVE